MKVTLTSCLDQPIVMCYRMPSTDGKPSPVLEVRVEPRTLCQEFSFPNENFYKEFKAQNQSLFDSQKIIEGTKIKGEHAEKISEEIAEKQSKQVAEKIDKTIEKVENQGKGSKRTGVKFEVESM